jgi:anthranilate phosphoribosyltransferase
MTTYSNGGDAITLDLDPADAGIDQANRGVPLSQAGEDDQDLASLARETAERARAALDGQTGPYRDSLVYATAIGLWRTGNTASLKDGADAARKAIDTGQARTVFDAGIK